MRVCLECRPSRSLSGGAPARSPESAAGRPADPRLTPWLTEDVSRDRSNRLLDVEVVTLLRRWRATMVPGNFSGAEIDFAIAGGIPHFVAAKVGAVGLCDRDLVRSAAGMAGANGLESIFPHGLAGGGG
jgi:hypothetical protein